MNDNGSSLVEEKAQSLEALSRSVVDTPSSPVLLSAPDTYILWIATAADGITPWSKAPKLRDAQLREFLPTENYFASALGMMTARNAGFNWILDGPPRTVAKVQESLIYANRGQGWVNFIVRLSIDLYTQDMGAYIELIRKYDDPDASVINIAHLDAARCFPTGNAEYPVIYQDRLGKYHKMAYYQIINLMEMPSPIEFTMGGVLYQLQYCTLTRALRAAQILRNVAIFSEEKTGGRFNRAIHLIKGVRAKEIKDALSEQQARVDTAGLQRYMQPLIVGALDPNAQVGHDTIDLANLPDGFSHEDMLKQYILALAMAFGVDYQDLAPLPGGNLGTSTQSEVLHMKSRGKGPAMFMKLISHFLNFQGILPKSVTFRWAEKDLAEEREKAEIALIRARTLSYGVISGIITPEIGRQLAVDSGDLSQEIYDALGHEDLTPDIEAQDAERVRYNKMEPRIQRPPIRSAP